MWKRSGRMSDVVMEFVPCTRALKNKNKGVGEWGWGVEGSRLEA